MRGISNEFMKEANKKFNIFVYIWIGFLIAGIIIYSMIVLFDIWKIIMLLTELIIIFNLSYIIVRDNIKSVFFISNLSRIYYGDSATDIQYKLLTSIRNLIDIFFTGFLFASVCLLLLCAYGLIIGRLQIELIMRSIMSIIIASGCVIIFGRLITQFTILMTVESSDRFFSDLKKDIKVYESVE